MVKKQKQQYMIFASNLRKHYDKWKKEKSGNTQETLAELIGIKDRKSISNYLNAIQYPEDDVLNNLCDVLGTTPKELNGLNDDFKTKYQYDTHTAATVRNGYDAFCAGIGLNQSFLKYVRSVLPDEEFPLFRPIESDPFSDQYYRADPEETAHTKTGSEYQIVTAAGVHTDLTYPDYAFLKDVQDQVTDLIEYLYFKRQKQLNEAVQKINDECVSSDQYGLTTVKQVTEKQLRESDPYYGYLLGDQGKIIKTELNKRKESDNGKY